MAIRSKFVVLPAEPIAVINPYLHGHFAEHLGELIYPGIYVSPDSPIPNTDGLRNDVVSALRPLEIPVLRWPGGCYADTYHWRDGIGPAAARKARVNAHWGMADEPNLFGTHEFMAFCRAIGAEPYFAANLGSGSPGEMQDWIEYCNFAGSSELARERRANGAEAPFHVRYWGIGNENWGCGGHMTPEQYAGEYSRYQTFAFNYPESPIMKVACGPSGPDWDWTRRFFETLAPGRRPSPRLGIVHGFAAHYYAGTAGNATEYSNAQWLELLAKAAAVEGVITGHRSMMDEYDPERKVKLFLDEWGAWHPVQAGKPKGGLYQQGTIRDACLAAITLDTFHRHADKLYMANIAQLVNVLQAILLVEEDKCIKTPTYYVFQLYKAHKGARAVRTDSLSEIVTYGGASEKHCNSCYRHDRFAGLRQVQGSASLHDRTLCITLVNSHPSEPADVEIGIAGGRMRSAQMVTLSADDIHDHNTFEQPDKVTLGPAKSVDGSVVTLRPASICRITGEL